MAALRHPVSRIVLLTLVSALAAAAQDDDKPFDCHITLDKINYDLTSLAGEHTISRSRSLPPSTIEDKVTFNLCEDLTRKSDVPEDEQVRSCQLITFGIKLMFRPDSVPLAHEHVSSGRAGKGTRKHMSSRLFRSQTRLRVQ